MKVLMLNGSPHKEGCTWRALCEIAKELEKEGIESEILHIGGQQVWGCMGCGACGTLGKCVHDEDLVNTAVAKMKECDGLIVGSPVHYASASGAITSFLDRFFYCGGSAAAHKPGAAIASARRAGTTATLDQLNKYFTFLIRCRWFHPVLEHGPWKKCRGNVQDEEGMQIMRTLGRNMAWLLKCIEAGRKAGITVPEAEPEKKRTSFIR